MSIRSVKVLCRHEPLCDEQVVAEFEKGGHRTVIWDCDECGQRWRIVGTPGYKRATPLKRVWFWWVE